MNRNVNNAANFMLNRLLLTMRSAVVLTFLFNSFVVEIGNNVIVN